jgi:DNA-binding transcriptional ArsR family regulator
MFEVLKQEPVGRLSENVVVDALGCLSHALRLQIYRLLVCAGSNGLVAGEIGEALRLPASNLSFHLKSLSHAELVSVEQQGRYQRYRANIPLMLRVIAYLTENCCSEDPAQCEAFRTAVPEVRPFLPPLAEPTNRTK